jgi:hypothetical protein
MRHLTGRHQQNGVERSHQMSDLAGPFGDHDDGATPWFGLSVDRRSNHKTRQKIARTAPDHAD